MRRSEKKRLLGKVVTVYNKTIIYAKEPEIYFGEFSRKYKFPFSHRYFVLAEGNKIGLEKGDRIFYTSKTFIF